MFERALGKTLAVLAVLATVAVLIVVGAIFVECASWGQCPEVLNVFSKTTTHETSGTAPAQ